MAVSVLGLSSSRFCDFTLFYDSALFLSPSVAGSEAFKRQNTLLKCLLFHCRGPVGRWKAVVHGIKCSCTHGRVCLAFKAFHLPLGRELGI